MLVVDTDPLAETMGQQQYERHSNDAQPSDKVVAHHVAHTPAHIAHIPMMRVLEWNALPGSVDACR